MAVAAVREETDKKCTEVASADMVGREIFDLFPGRCTPLADGGAPVRQVRGLGVSGYDARVSFAPCRSEILGLDGLFGTGRSDVLRSVLGIRRAAGERPLDSRRLPLGNRAEVVRRGIALVQEDRKAADVPTTMSALDNVTLPHLDAFAGLRGAVDNASRIRAALDVLQSVRPNYWRLGQRVAQLSGDGQQKGALPQWPVTQSR